MALIMAMIEAAKMSAEATLSAGDLWARTLEARPEAASSEYGNLRRALSKPVHREWRVSKYALSSSSDRLIEVAKSGYGVGELT